MTPEYIIQQIFNGIVFGAMYALLALGMTVIYGILRLIHFAHGALITVGSFCFYFLFMVLGLPFPASIVLVIGLGALMGVILDTVAYKKAVGGPEAQGKSHLRRGACLPAERLAGLEGRRRRAPTVDAAAGEAARPVRGRVPQRAPRTGTSLRSHWSHFLSSARAAARPQTVLGSTVSVICAVAAEKSQRRPSLRA